MNNSSSLSAVERKNSKKIKQPSSLPPISSSQALKYQNDYQNYEDQLHEFKVKQKEESIKNDSSSVSKNSSIFSSSLSSSGKKSTDKQESPECTSPESVKSDKKIIPYEESPNFWRPSQQNPYIQHSAISQYKQKSTSEISSEIKSMRHQFVEMNKKLTQMLNEYNMAKTQFVSKQLMGPSKSEFYEAQIETNRKIEQSQVSQLKKLNSTQLLVKDKDVLIDLEQVLIQMRTQLHHARKEEHDSKLKNHKKDIVLDQIIKVNSDNKDNNAVKLLKMQIIYYMKKQNSLKIHEEQLDHEEKLIRENDKNLEAKVEEMKKVNTKMSHLFDQKYSKLKEKRNELIQKKNTLVKSIETYKRSSEITEEKYARQILQVDSQIRKAIRPSIATYQQQNQQLQSKINTLITAYNLNENSLRNISYKFSPDLISKDLFPSSKKPLIRSILKPNFITRPKSKIQDSNFLSSRIEKTQKKQTLSNQKTNTNRYNDKNVSMTIDVSLQAENNRLRSISEGMNHLNLKPKNFRILSKKEKDYATSRVEKSSAFATTIDYAGGNYEMKSIETDKSIQKGNSLKPNLFGAKTKR